MVHLRLIVPTQSTEAVVAALAGMDSVCNIVTLKAAAQKPEGDLVLCDVAREDASAVLARLKPFRLEDEGSIALEEVDASFAKVNSAAEAAAPGAPADAIIWQQVQEKTVEMTRLSFHFLVFMVLSSLIAAIGIYLNSPILIVGAMVLGPEFGPIAALCVGVTLRSWLSVRDALKLLLLGFALAITAAWLITIFFRSVGTLPPVLNPNSHQLAIGIAHPDELAFAVACFAGIAGMLSLVTAKSNALIGVLISVTTIPAAANIGVAAAYGNWELWRGSQFQLLVNFGALVAMGVVTLLIARFRYVKKMGYGN